MKILKQILNNYIWVVLTLFVTFTVINFIESFWKTYSDTDSLWSTFIVFLSIAVYAFIFIVIHSLISIRNKSIFNLKEHKLLVLIPLASSLFSEIFDFRWFGLIRNIDNAVYFNFIVLCVVLLFLFIVITKKMLSRLRLHRKK